jgi:hypothetical protein
MVAEAPPEAGPETGDNAGSSSAPPASAPPEIKPRNETIYEEDDFDSFMEDMLDDQAALDRNPRAEPTGGSEETTTSPAGALVRPAGAPRGHAPPDPDIATTSSARSHPPPPPAPTKPATTSIRTAEVMTPSTVDAAGIVPTGSASPIRPVPQGGQIAVVDGLVAIDLEPVDEPALAVGSIAFDPGSATLPAGARPVLKQWLGEANAQGAARVKIVAEAAAPALALDRARAIGLALVQGGLSADRLELNHADGPGGDRARVFLASP